ACDGRDHSIREPRCPRAEHSQVLCRELSRVNHVVPITPCVYQRWDEFWGMLEVAVHRHNDVADGMVESRGQCCLMPEVPRQQQIRDVLVSLMEKFEASDRVI